MRKLKPFIDSIGSHGFRHPQDDLTSGWREVFVAFSRRYTVSPSLQVPWYPADRYGLVDASVGDFFVLRCLPSCCHSADRPHR